MNSIFSFFCELNRKQRPHQLTAGHSRISRVSSFLFRTLVLRLQREATKAGKVLRADAQPCPWPAVLCSSFLTWASLKLFRCWDFCLEEDPFSLAALLGHLARISLCFHPISGFLCFEELGTFSTVYTSQSCTNSWPLPSLVT